MRQIERSKMPQRGSADYWKKRAKVWTGPMKVTPEELWMIACHYFGRTDEDPIVDQEFIKNGQHAGEYVDKKRRRVYNWSGLYDYIREALGTNLSMWINKVRDNKRGEYDDFAGTIADIENIMYADKFEGACAGIYSSSVIIRDLGLTEKSTIETNNYQPLFGPLNPEGKDEHVQVHESDRPSSIFK